MPDTRAHRGPHPKDRVWFAPDRLVTLREAHRDFSWLLSRGYSGDAALKLVGDHYQLTGRQRMALSRSACSESASARRRARRIEVSELAGRAVGVDGFNCLITLEAALSGGLVLRTHDGSLRDLSSVHGTYRNVEETDAAARALTNALESGRPDSVVWYLDSPVSNSGKLATRLRTLFQARGLDWQVALEKDADRAIRDSGAVAASSDGGVLDAVPAWVDLAGAALEASVPNAWLIDLNAPT